LITAARGELTQDAKADFQKCLDALGIYEATAEKLDKFGVLDPMIDLLTLQLRPRSQCLLRAWTRR